jgi:hypothetical protein
MKGVVASVLVALTTGGGIADLCGAGGTNSSTNVRVQPAERR